MQQLKDISPEEKPKFAKELNILKGKIEEIVKTKKKDLQNKELESKLDSEYLDLSYPSTGTGLGAVNPVRLVERKILSILKPFGFVQVEGPEVETEYYCFDSLNIPAHHPARDMQDTFYVDTGHLLRTHTTSVQARELEKGNLPVKIISAGRVYRNETEDTTHQAMFHQFELVWIEKDITIANLMGILTHILKKLYGEERRVRFVPKFYPYTDPRKGCRSCEDSGWVTILGAGMVHEKVLREFNYDPKEVSGMAFGLGTSRLAAQFYNAPNLKILYDNDLRYLSSLV
ncbi:UNVERIFIED_CONTAM: hypothetical protein GTU68_064427 [Idotea baltica]|nr:hypothetical protein [Idotea baltica]